MSNFQEKKNLGYKPNEVWDYFQKTQLKSPGHYSAKCNFCNHLWSRAYIQELQLYLTNECLICPNDYS